MRLSRKLFVAVLPLIVIGLVSDQAQEPVRRYSETRSLLLKMDRRSGNEALGKLFSEADIRREDLLAAVDDETESVQINAQVILRYASDPGSLRALDDRIKSRVAQRLKTSSP